jgi:hypothetical protein
MAEEKEKKPKAAAKPAAAGKPKAEGKPKGEKRAKGGEDGAENAPVSNRPVPPARLLGIYRERVVPSMMKRFNYSNVN